METNTASVPYDSKTPAEVVHDYAVVRGDLSAQYARDQLALWIERYAAHLAEARAESAEAEVERLLDLFEDTTGMNGGAPMEPVKSVPAPLPTSPAHEDDE